MSGGMDNDNIGRKRELKRLRKKYGSKSRDELLELFQVLDEKRTELELKERAISAERRAAENDAEELFLLLHACPSEIEEARR